MDVLTRIRAGGREIHCGLLATTRHERAAAQAQRFRIYERRGYYRPGLRTDRDVYDTKAAAYFLALLPTGHRSGVLLGSARVILGDARAGFRLPPSRPSSSSYLRRSQPSPRRSGSRSPASWPNRFRASSSAGC